MHTLRTLSEINMIYRITGFEFYDDRITAIVSNTRKHYLERNLCNKQKEECIYDYNNNQFITPTRIIPGENLVPWKEL
jgi:hypothetical protein